MAILAQCPGCRRRQSNKNKFCSVCGTDLDKSKRSKRVKYWISYRLPDGTQRQEVVGYSIEEARDAEGKRRSQKREGRIFDLLLDSRMTFQELSAWYLNLPTTKRLASYRRIKITLNNFNRVFGDKLLKSIKPVDLERYQIERLDNGIATTTVDLEVSTIKGMVSKGFDNDMVGGRVLKAFRTIKRVSTKSQRARHRTISVYEYQRLISGAASHIRLMMIVAYNTGMRPGEVRGLRCSHVDRKTGFVRLPAEMTKEKAARVIPINHYVKEALGAAVRHIDHEHVFTYQGRATRRSAKAIKTACRRAGIPYGRKTPDGIVLHDFRRSFKTNCLKAGIDKIYRDLLVGHSLKGMDAHYIVPTDDDLCTAMGKFTDWLDSELQIVNQSVNQE